MREDRKCGCARGRAAAGEFDARLAYERLSQKVTELGEVLGRYVSQAGLERSERVGNAERMARALERIVGGSPVRPGRFAECCLIGQLVTNAPVDWFCTGVLVHPRVVLTAAHCHETPADRANIVVALGAENMDRLGNAEVIRARRVTIHPDYLRDGPHDIAVIVLRSGARTRPVPIATTAELATATRTRLVGFGRDDVMSTRGFGIKREVEVRINHLRRSAHDDLDEAEQTFEFESDLEFTAGGDGFDSCNGDSGGPAYILAGGGRKVAGLTSRGFRSSQTPCGGGGIYTRIDANLGFVRQAAAGLGFSA